MEQSTSNPDFAKLSIEQRITLIGEIWDSIGAEAGAFPLTSAQRQELDRRVEEYEKSPDAGVPWEEVKRGLNAR